VRSIRLKVTNDRRPEKKYWAFAGILTLTIRRCTMIVSLRIAEKSSCNAPPKNMFIAKFATTTALEAFPTAAVAAARVAACEGSS
jgi:hypothetical protein